MSGPTPAAVSSLTPADAVDGGQQVRARVIPADHLTSDDDAAWRRWCDGAPAVQTAFRSPVYVRAVAEVWPFVRVCVIERAGDAIAFFPFQYPGLVHLALGAAVPVGAHMTDYAGVVCAPCTRLSSASLLRHARLSSYVFTHLDESQLDLGLAGEQPEPGFRVDVRGGAADYWAALRSSDRKLVADTERRERKLVQEYGPLRFRLREPEPQTGLQYLIERKREQYRLTRVHDALAPRWTRRLLETLARSDDPGCAGVLSTLHAGETWVASHFGLRSGNVLHYWFPVYNRALHQFAPGRLLLKAIIDAARENGIGVIDRGAGQSQAKRDLANDRHLYYRGAWYRPGLRALSARAAMSAGWRVAAWRRTAVAGE